MNTNVNEKRPVNKRAVVKIVIWSVVFCLLGLLLLSSVTGVSTDVTVFGLPGIHLSLGGFTYEDANEYSVGNASVKGSVTDLEIVWLAGDITVIPSDTDEIKITEDYSGDDDGLRLRWLLKDSKLTVAQYTKNTAKALGGSIEIKKFVRFEKGEGIEKRQDDFAAEVASMVQ